MAPSPFQDRECTECISSCPAGEQLTGECITEQRTCTACPTGKYKESEGGYSCLPCATSCGPSEYLTGTCTATQSPVCRQCPTQCDNGFYLSGVCDGSRSVPECKECLQCEDDEYMVKQCSSANGGSDTVCASCTQTCPSNYYMSTPCSAQADSVCTECTQTSDCLSTEVLVGTCGGTDNTQCVSCHPECLTCFGPGSSQCESCNRGLFLKYVCMGEVVACWEGSGDAVVLWCQLTVECSSVYVCAQGRFQTTFCSLACLPQPPHAHSHSLSLSRSLDRSISFSTVARFAKPTAGLAFTQAP